MFDKIINYVKNHIWIIFVLIAVIAAIVVISIIRNKIATKRKYQQMFIDMAKKKESIVSPSIEAKLARMEFIGKNNIAFYDAFENLKQEYDTLISVLFNEYNRLYKHAKKEIENKNYNGFKETFDELDGKLETYSQDMHIIENRIDSVIKDDEELKNAEFDLNNRIQNLTQRIANHSEELVHIKKHLKFYLDGVQNKLDIFNDYINKGNYLDAKDVMNQVTEKVEYLEAVLDRVIQAALVLTITLPNSINEVINKYKQMTHEGYPLKHINLATRINDATVVLRDLIAKLKKLDVTDFDAVIQNIVEEIDQCDVKMKQEEESKLYFDNFNLRIYEDSLALDREYIKHIKEGKELLKVYESNEERRRLDHTIKTEVQKLGVARRDLDSLNYGNQPYSLRVQKLKELENQASIVRGYLKASCDNFKGMENINKYAQDLIEEKASQIRKLEIKAMNTKLEKIIQNYQDEFQNAYRIIDRINNLINTTPVDIEEVKEKCDQLIQQADYLKIRVEDDVANSFKAESLIKYANNYRPLYSNISRDLAKAEIYFYDGKYIDCINLLKDTLQGFDYTTFLEREHKDEILG